MAIAISARSRRSSGCKLALKGNLHTTVVMLEMSPDGVEAQGRKRLDDAMEGGGFVLATGDQCGLSHAEVNITRLVEVCEKYGTVLIGGYAFAK